MRERLFDICSCRYVWAEVSFTITRLKVENFRNYREFELEPGVSLTVLVGPNATGKTNLIEAVELLTETDSFRKPQWAEVIRWGASESRISLQASDGERRHDAEMTVTADGRRRYRSAGKPKRSASDIAGIIPCVVFTPDDLRIVKDSAEKRRTALDAIGSQLSPNYRRLKLEYDRVVRQRNTLLKQERVNEEDIAPWDERLVSLGSRVHSHRKNLFGRVREHMVRIHDEIAPGVPLTASYVPSWNREGGTQDEDEEPTSALERYLAAKKDEELTRRVTLVGPHRDDFTFTIGGHDARSFGSQGQQRTAALAFKLAEVSVVTDVSGERPVLLLDDVMSELDETRREALTSHVGNAAQTFITTTDIAHFSESLIADATVVELT